MFDTITILKGLIALYGSYITLGLICFVILGVMLLLLVSILTKHHISIGLGFFKLNLGSKNNIPLNHVTLITSLLEYQESYIRNAVQAESDCFKRQMNYCEQKLQEIKFLMLSNYSTILNMKLPQDEDVKNHRDFRSYQILISILIKELLDKIFYPLLMQNHLEEMDETAWKNYVNDKINYVFNFGTEFTDNLYGNGKLVSRNECYESEKKLNPDIKLVLKEIFENVKHIAIQNKIELKKDKLEAENHIKEICKNNGLSQEE